MNSASLSELHALLGDPDAVEPVVTVDSDTNQVTVTDGTRVWSLELDYADRLLSHRMNGPSVTFQKAARLVSERLDEVREEQRIAEAARKISQWSPAAVGLQQHPSVSGRWYPPEHSDRYVICAPSPDIQGVMVCSFYLDGAAEPVFEVTSEDPFAGFDTPVAPDFRVRYNDTERYNRMHELRKQDPLVPYPENPDELFGHLLTGLDQYQAWVQSMVALRDESDTEKAAAEQAKREASKEWRRKTRSGDAIPTQPLATALKKLSHIDYDKGGWASGGWEAMAMPIESEERPAAADSKSGPQRLMYVARIENRQAVGRSRRKRAGVRFYSSDADKLRVALPSCVVKIPEDGKVMFVARDLPAHTARLDAEIATWILTDHDDEDTDDIW